MKQKQITVQEYVNGYEISCNHRFFSDKVATFYEDDYEELPKGKLAIVECHGDNCWYVKDNKLIRRKIYHTLIDVLSSQEEAKNICKQKASEISTEINKQRNYPIIHKTLEEIST